MRRSRSSGFFAVAVSAISLVACVSNPSSPPPAGSPPPAAFSDGLHWFRNSVERQAIYLETYREATTLARELSKGLTPQTWGVILDVDETVLDNSEYMKRLAVTGQRFDPHTWDTWVQERNATALPGSKSFIDTIIDQLHGQVVFVTNRAQSQCQATEDNLRRENLRFTRILCDSIGNGDKNVRFRSVINGERGTTAPLNVLIWIGDNIRDFPDLDQNSPGDLALFGIKYFTLPNPMYGSWQQVPAH